MSSDATKPVIVRCLACKAVTKVSGIPDDKETIRCPKCKQPVSLKAAKPAPERPAGAMSERSSLPQPTAEDYKRANKGKLGRRAARMWLGVAIGVGVSLFVLALVLTLTWNGEKQAVPDSPHVQLLKEMNDAYGRSIDEMDGLKSPPEVFDFNSRHGKISAQLQDLNNRYSLLSGPEKSDLDQILRLESDLQINKRRYQESRQRIAKLVEGIDPLNPSGRSPAALAPTPSAAGASAAASSPRPTGTKPSLVITDVGTPASIPSSPTKAEPTVAAASEKERVTLTILNLPKEKASTAFLARIQALAGGRARILSRNWAGDLLVIELGPVADLDRFAARLAFGQVTQLDKSQRTITLLARSEAVAADGSLPELPSDPFETALADLQSKDVEKRRKGSLELLQMKPDVNRADAVQALTLALAEKDLQAKLSVLKALARWGGAESVDALATQLADENPQVRRTVLDLLGQIKDPRAADAIVRDCIVKDREAAGAALQQLGAKAEPAVLPLLRHEAAEVRVEACRILKRIGTRTAVPELLKLTDEVRSPVPEAAWEAIAGIASRRG